ncbi:MAG TPA: transcription factor, partial [Methanocorpusculum sp.]|nr:transcription factor [Methanocorpusculum sp.]
MTAITEEQLQNPAIYQYLLKLVGDEGIELLRRCPNEELSDEDIAAKTEINLNSVRHTLYNLYEHRLAEYRRIKNNETGWLTYLWVMRMDN